MRLVLGQREGVGQPDAGEGQPGLALEERQVLDRPQRLVGRPVQHRRHIRRCDRAIAHALAAGLDLDQRLQPDHAAGAVAHQRHVKTARLGFAEDGLGHLVRAKGAGGGIAGNVDLHARISFRI